MSEVGPGTAVRLAGVCEALLSPGTTLKDTIGHMEVQGNFPGRIFTTTTHRRENSVTNWPSFCCLAAGTA